jgi:hypothetical protein
MGRIVSLVGKQVSGDWIGLAQGDNVHDVVNAYVALRSSGGVVAKGRSEIKLVEARLLGNHTAGGELKPRLRFVV